MRRFDPVERSSHVGRFFFVLLKLPWAFGSSQKLQLATRIDKQLYSFHQKGGGDFGIMMDHDGINGSSVKL